MPNSRFAPKTTLSSAIFFACIAALGVGAPGCTNNRIIGKVKLNGNYSNNFSDPGNEATGPVSISRVLKSNFSPSTELDVVGIGDGAMGMHCLGGSGAFQGAGEGASSCACHYEYQNPATGLTESVDVPTSYYEANLIRCPYDVLTTGVNNIKVRVHLASGSYSNPITFAFEGVGTSLDLSLASSYGEVKRFQCRDHVTIDFMWPQSTTGGTPSAASDATGDNALYDPFQSDTTRVSYARNYYAIDKGSAIKAFGLAGATRDYIGAHDCSYDSGQNPQAWESLNIYSREPDSTGSRLIFPASGGAFDRSTFHLARKKSGIFNVPVNGFIAPGTVTASPDAFGNQPAGFEPPIGWGVRPGANQSCPAANVAIPEGYHWVKVWAFRAGLYSRTYVRGSQSVSSTFGIFCNPGLFDTPPAQPNGVFQPFPDCANPNGPNPQTQTTQFPLTDTFGAGNLAARAFLNGGKQACFRTVAYDNQASVRGGGNLDFASLPNPPVPNPNPNGITGGDSLYRLGSNVNSNFVDMASLPWNFTQSFLQTVPAAGPEAIQAPIDDINKFIYGNLDGGGAGVSRYDFLFVTTPTNITVEMMGNGVNGDPDALPYVPFTFKRREDCSDPNPTNCYNFDARNIDYELYRGEIPNDGGLQNTFPLCALQPD
ncbi:MAG: hypothetical protein AB7P04_06290 [Bacteriovoracia bacterium]